MLHLPPFVCSCNAEYIITMHIIVSYCVCPIFPSLRDGDNIKGTIKFVQAINYIFKVLIQTACIKVYDGKHIVVQFCFIIELFTRVIFTWCCKVIKEVIIRIYMLLIVPNSVFPVIE